MLQYASSAQFASRRRASILLVCVSLFAAAACISFFAAAAHIRSSEATSTSGTATESAATFDVVAPGRARPKVPYCMQPPVTDLAYEVKHLDFCCSHQLGQTLAAQVLQGQPISNVSTGLLQEAQHYAMLTRLFDGAIGLYHGSVWFVAGTRELTWELISTSLCPRPEYEFVQHCMHGLGHSGFIRMQGNFSKCSHVSQVNKEDLTIAYMTCKNAPSTFLEFLCSQGFYHGVWEYFNPYQGSWLEIAAPCLDPALGHTVVCWTYLFLTFSQSLSRAGGASAMDIRRDKLLVRRSRNMCGGLPLLQELNCIYGFLSQMHFNGYSPLVASMLQDDFGVKLRTTWHEYFPYKDGYFMLPAEDVGADVIEACMKLTAGPAKDWARWHACYSGSFSWWLSHMFNNRPMSLPERERICIPLLNVTAAGDAHGLCMEVIKFGYHSFPQSRALVADEYGIFPHDVPPSWDRWFKADVHEEQYRYYMAPFG